ncbi:SdiA-regulated domain-containing protein [Paradesertivirga mongoliensis]|uniref:SdiA-regulated domain-containing protein n=1 Tax=Paradesertivirga mongoliensis TaxID=2100740 RepID=A0ABW4ZRQ6_9SPHI|nr:SdiA-regulated domain-containing protein [Pedobacter mongoliensis]
MRTAIYIVVFIILSIGIAFTIRSTDIEKVVIDRNDKKEKKDKKNKEEPAGSPDIQVLNKYDVPSVLKEISALVYLDKNRFACVQDELGKIFIYNSDTQKLEKEIPFAASGDYEGLAIVDQTAYVLRADGQIFELKNYLDEKPSARIHKTHLTSMHNTEGLCYDSKNNRLLIAIKDTEPQNKQYKGIYGFSLSSMKMEKEPVYKIDLNSAVLEPFKSKKQGSQMQPSAIAIHPKTGDLYITDGAKPKLLIMDQQGAIKTVKILSSKEFNQPEGISFSPEGRLFISNEGSKQPGNIVEVKYPTL